MHFHEWLKRHMTIPLGERGHASANAVSLADALENDPFYAAITDDFSGDAVQRRGVLEAYFDYSMKEGARLGCCTVLPDDDIGAAVWIKPKPKELLSQSKSEKHRFLESTLGRNGLADYHRIIGFMSPRAEQVVGSHVWYLSILGVSPHAQGRGFGRRLLEPTLNEADRANTDCFLETYSPKAISFYERLGFRCIVSHVEPVTSSEYWIMVRKPSDAPR